MQKSAVLGVVLVLALAGCGQTKTVMQKTEKILAEKAVAALPPKAENSPPPVAPKKPRVLLEPTVVLGKTTTEISTAFGDPTLLRQDAPAEVWQYLATDCALHLFFYPAQKGGDLVVSHIAINGRSAASQSDLDRKKCFNDHLTAVGAEDAFVFGDTS